MDVDSTGNVYFASHQGTPSDWHIYKFAPDGAELWHRTWGRAVGDQAFLVVVAEPFVYVGGNSESAANALNPYRPATDMAIIALRADTGALAWERVHDFAGAYDEVDGIVVEDDAVYVSGWASGKTSSVDIGLLKLNKSNGQVAWATTWATTWGTNNWDEGDGQMVILGDKIYVGGRYNAPTSIVQTFLGGQGLIAVFEKASGKYLRHTTWGKAGNVDDALGMTTDGAFLYTVGLTSRYGQGGQMLVNKYTTDLKQVWERAYGGADGESARAIEVDSTSGDVFIAGTTGSYGAGSKDIPFLRYTAAADLVYATFWGGSAIDVAQGIALFGPYVYIAGNTTSVGVGGSDPVLIKAAKANGAMIAA